MSATDAAHESPPSDIPDAPLPDGSFRYQHRHLAEVRDALLGIASRSLPDARAYKFIGRCLRIVKQAHEEQNDVRTDITESHRRKRMPGVDDTAAEGETLTVEYDEVEELQRKLRDHDRDTVVLHFGGRITDAMLPKSTTPTATRGNNAEGIAALTALLGPLYEFDPVAPAGAGE